MKKAKDKFIDAIGQIDDQFIQEAHDKKKKSFVFDWAFTGKILTGLACLMLVVNIVPNFFRMGATKDTAVVSESADYDMSVNTYGFDGGQGGVGDYKYTDDESYYEDTKPQLAEDKKLIVTGDISIETLDFDTLLASLKANISVYGGYIQNSSINSNQNASRHYNATIRIPADKYNEFIEKTKQTGNVTWYSEYVDDITTTYTDLQARVNSLKAEENKVLEFYNQATNLEELMMIEDRLTDIRYEIDSIETRIKNYDLLTSYATLNISVYETKTYTKTNDNFFSRLSLSFKNGLNNFVNSIENLIIDIVYNIWTIVLFAIIVTIVILVVKKIRKIRNK